MLPFFLFFFLFTWINSDNFFFWDTIQLASEHATFFYENDFSSIFLPEDMDSGHIPAFGMYLALVWELFGRTLPASHFAMLPFLFGIIWQSYHLLKKFIAGKYLFFAAALFLADATLLAQSALVSPDIPLIFFFLFGVNAILEDRRLFLALAVSGLILSSNRGGQAAAALFIFGILLNIESLKGKRIFDTAVICILIFLPAFLIFIGYHSFHYEEKGWFGWHEDSPWAPSFEPVDLKGFLKNLFVLGWRMIDFGRASLWIVAVLICLKYFKQIKNDRNIKLILVLFALVLIFQGITFTFYYNLAAHRYLLPAYLMFSLFVNYLIFEKIKRKSVKILTACILLMCLLAGNKIIYPEHVAQGWDSSLAHLPYYELRKKMNDYLEENGIDYSSVSSDFPDKAKRKFIDLTDSDDFHPVKNLNKDKYVLYTNVSNNFSEKEIEQLNENYFVVKEFEKRGVFIRLYKKKERIKQADKKRFRADRQFQING